MAITSPLAALPHPWPAPSRVLNQVLELHLVLQRLHSHLALALHDQGVEGRLLCEDLLVL